MIISNLQVTKSQNWETGCPTDECRDSQNQQWVYLTSQKIPMSFLSYQSPNCWVKIVYRKRDPLPNCPNQECEIEIQTVIISGDCFLPYTDNTAVPPITYNAQLDPTQYINISDYYRDIWIFAINIWGQSGVEPCLTPLHPGDCKYIYHFKSASCKKLIQNQNNDYELVYCEDFNSCCRESISVCRKNDNTIECVWGAHPSFDINNCYLNNDPSCTFTCYNYGEGGWIPPKISFLDIELNKDVFLKYSNTVLNYNLLGKEYYCQITDLFGRLIYSQMIKGTGAIEFQKELPGMLIVKLSNNNQQRTFKIMVDK